MEEALAMQTIREVAYKLHAVAEMSYVGNVMMLITAIGLTIYQGFGLITEKPQKSLT